MQVPSRAIHPQAEASKQVIMMQKISISQGHAGTIGSLQEFRVSRGGDIPSKFELVLRDVLVLLFHCFLDILELAEPLVDGIQDHVGIEEDAGYFFLEIDFLCIDAPDPEAFLQELSFDLDLFIHERVVLDHGEIQVDHEIFILNLGRVCTFLLLELIL